jgi:hypothetical protein
MLKRTETCFGPDRRQTEVSRTTVSPVVGQFEQGKRTEPIRLNKLYLGSSLDHGLDAFKGGAHVAHIPPLAQKP